MKSWVYPRWGRRKGIFILSVITIWAVGIVGLILIREKVSERVKNKITQSHTIERQRCA